ncbi:uncharacterized protein LOC113204043 [Frankliniella occidentalis]|uniref:Uncharacterized protein LOC113204043 n=1 Tax=Frankliniella occidentalis TaxID=133901 RepID=A0A6J1S0Z3_FRAOC|nr:uncharacterized protein LOC113204043 [Frankliniella occidentalis]
MSRKEDMSANTYDNMNDQQEQNNNVEIETKIKHKENLAGQNNETSDFNESVVNQDMQTPIEKISVRGGSKEVRANECCTSDKLSNGRESQKSKYIKRHPWITEEFLEMVEHRDELRLKLRNNSSNVLLKKEFALLRNRTAALRRKLKLAYQMYLEEL